MNMVVTPENFDAAFPVETRERYWAEAEAVIVQILPLSLEAREIATRALASYRASLSKAPISEQMLAFHESPLHLAAALAGVEPDARSIEGYAHLVGRGKSGRN